MKHLTFLVLSVSALLATCVSAKSHAPKEANHTVIVTGQSEVISFAASVEVEVAYVNNSQKIWQIPTPERSASVDIQYRAPGAKGIAHGYSLGRVILTTITLSNGNEFTAFVKPNPPKITIDPHKAYKFSTPLERDWSGHLMPGRWNVWIEDHKLEMKSEPLELTLRFTSKSVDGCLAIAKDAEDFPIKRRWHAEWLQKIKPDLNVDVWPRSNTEKVTPREEPRIKAEVKEFETWWAKNKKSKAVEKAIAAINKKAGLPEEEKKESAD